MKTLFDIPPRPVWVRREEIPGYRPDNGPALDIPPLKGCAMCLKEFRPRKPGDLCCSGPCYDRWLGDDLPLSYADMRRTLARLIDLADPDDLD